MEIRERIELLAQNCTRLIVEDYVAKGYITEPEKILVEYISDKWAKLVKIGPGTWSAFCFIALIDNKTKNLGEIKAGDIYKQASWNQPAKHARGNVFEEDYLTKVGPYGPAYLK